MSWTCSPIGPELQARRRYRRLSQRELADLVGPRVNQSTICRLERGDTEPTGRVLRALEAVLGRFDQPDPERAHPAATQRMPEAS